MTREEFDAWRTDPVTRWAMSTLTRGAELQREKWMHESWNNAHCNKFELMELRNKAAVYGELPGMSYEDFCVLNGEEPDNE